MINHLLVAVANNHARKRFAAQTAIEISCQNKVLGYAYPGHCTALFHNQEGYYSSLILEAFDLPPQVGGVFICCTICNLLMVLFYTVPYSTLLQVYCIHLTSTLICWLGFIVETITILSFSNLCKQSTETFLCPLDDLFSKLIKVNKYSYKW